MAAQRLLVVGGNGFLGSAVCKAAVSKGWDVSSISSSGRPFKTPKRHTPAWVDKVQWHAASAFAPTTYTHLLHPSKTTAVVHTLGTLFENSGYKDAVKSGNIGALFGAVLGGVDDGRNPLKEKKQEQSYQGMNHDSALSVFEAFRAASDPADPATPTSPESENKSRPFIYISAEDIFYPIVPRGYIDSKRQAERDIWAGCGGDIRGVLIRPGLMYHPHLRPLTTPIAAALSAAANAQRIITSSTPLPSLSSLLRFVPLFESAANLLEVPPMHVDQVAQAVCFAVERNDVEGVVGVREMRDLIGWRWEGGTNAHA